MSKYEFRPNIGRLQKVMSSQEYGKKEHKNLLGAPLSLRG